MRITAHVKVGHQAYQSAVQRVCNDGRVQDTPRRVNESRIEREIGQTWLPC